ncbi:MAG TPA: HAD family hydrolase [Tepiditoga sp.]|nr:HAD family hydrolase [Tepiditoga sp.]
MNYKSVKNIVFDIDGTLVDTKKVTIPAFEMVLTELKNEGYEIEIDPKEILKYIGYTIDSIFINLLKTNDKILIEKSIKLLDKYEEEVLDKTENIFFDGVLEVMEYLRKNGKKLFLLSNCNIKYMNKILEKGLKEYIDSPNCSEMFDWKEKDYVLKTLMEKELSDNFIMIGDRKHDMNAALKNNIPCVGCDYGYGSSELTEASVKIKNIKELLDIL